MGRGRAKAKQTKVARELKYREFNTDFSELQRELHGDGDPRSVDDSDPIPAESDAYDDTAVNRYDDDSRSLRTDAEL